MKSMTSSIWVLSSLANHGVQGSRSIQPGLFRHKFVLRTLCKVIKSLWNERPLLLRIEPDNAFAYLAVDFPAIPH